MRKKTELANPSTCHTEECGRLYVSSPTRRYCGAFDSSMMLGEETKSTALGVESVFRKVRGERRYVATERRFRHAPSNQTRGRFSGFSPCQTRATEISFERERRKTRIIGRIHSAVLSARSRSGLTFLNFPQISALSVVKSNKK